IRQRLVSQWFTVHQYHSRLRFELADPFYQTRLAGMGRETAQGFYAGLDQIGLTKQLDMLSSVHQYPPKCPPSLEANEDKGIVFIPDALFEVVANTSTITHATAGNHNSTAGNLVDRHG